MATFPDLNRIIADDRAPDTGLITIIAPNGALFGQSLYADEYWVFSPTFIHVSQGEVDALNAFYAANKTVAFDYQYKHLRMATITYECYFIDPGISVIPTEATENNLPIYIARATFRGRIKP